MNLPKRNQQTFCRLLRYEVTEQLAQKRRPLAADWPTSSFPKRMISNSDGYAQVATFGPFMFWSSNIRLAGGLDQVGRQHGTPIRS